MKDKRLICVSSLFQLLVAHSCIKKESKEFTNIIILTNPNTHKNNLIKYKKIAKILGYKKIVDFSKIVRNLRPKNINEAQNIYKKTVNTNDVKEILVRYKLNLFEHSLINTFKKARISLFEDGIGDYMKRDLLEGKRKKNYIKDFIKFIYFKLKSSEVLTNFYSNNVYKKRIFKKFELIDDNNGNLKSQHISNKPFISIKGNFLSTLKKFKPEKFKKKTILFLLHDIDELNDPARLHGNDFKKNINYYLKAKKILEAKYPEHSIIFKTHPNVRKSTLKKLKNEYKFNCFSKNLITEMLFYSKNISHVVGFSSSSLIYGKKIFKKKTISFNTNQLDFHAVNDQRVSILDVLKRFKVVIININ